MNCSRGLFRHHGIDTTSKYGRCRIRTHAPRVPLVEGDGATRPDYRSCSPRAPLRLGAAADRRDLLLPRVHVRTSSQRPSAIIRLLVRRGDPCANEGPAQKVTYLKLVVVFSRPDSWPSLEVKSESSPPAVVVRSMKLAVDNFPVFFFFFFFGFFFFFSVFFVLFFSSFPSFSVTIVRPFTASASERRGYWARSEVVERQRQALDEPRGADLVLNLEGVRPAADPR